jgi:hypothetical protein
MQNKTIHVTDHAVSRWVQRISVIGVPNVSDIIDAVHKSQLIKKKQALPFGVPRFDNTVYSYHKDFRALFVLEPVAINELRLITVISSFSNTRYVPKTKAPVNQNIKDRQRFTRQTIMNNSNLCENPVEERDYLLSEKQKLEKQIGRLSKNDPERELLINTLEILRSKLSENKRKNNKNFENFENFERKKDDSDLHGILVDLKNKNTLQQDILKTLKLLKK